MARKLEVQIVGDASSLNRALGSASKNTETFGAKLGRMAKMAALGAGAAGVGLLVIGLKKSISAAMEAQAVHARLGVAFKDAGLRIGAYGKALDKAEASGRKLGFTDDETLTAMGSLVTATKNVGAAVKDLGVAQDVARFKGVNLADASKMITMAMTGSQRAAKQLGITVAPVTRNFDALGKGATKAQKAHAKFLDKIATGNAVIDAVKAHIHGQAEAFSKTLPGAIAEAKAWLNHFEIELGNKLLPLIQQAIVWLKANWPQIKETIRQTWLGIKPTLVAFRDEVKLVVGFIKNNWSTIGPVVQAVAGMVKAALAVMTAPLRIIIALLRGDWHQAWQIAVSTVKGAVSAISGLVKALGNAAIALGKAIITGILHGLKSIGGEIIGYLEDLARRAITAAISAVTGFFGGGPSTKGHSGSNRGTFGGHRAAGGSVKAGQTYLVGEKGPELFSSNKSGNITANHHIDKWASHVVHWSNHLRRFMLETSFGDKGIRTIRMQRDWFNNWKGRGISPAEMRQVIPWWESEGFFEQLASRKKKFDSGGWLMPGATLAINNTGKPERVGGKGGNTYHFHFPNYVGSKQELAQTVRSEFVRMQRSGASLGFA